MKQLLKSFSLWLMAFLMLGLFLGQVQSHGTDAVHIEPGQICGGRDMLINKLAKDFDEHLSKAEKLKDDKVIELYKNEQSGTWTLMLSHSNGISCVVSFGEDEPAKPEPTSYTL